MTTYSEAIYQAVCRIPVGKVATYGQIARLLGHPRGARIVGYALHRNPKQGEIPCHRVVFRDGSLCEGYAFGGIDVQRGLLQMEGVSFLSDGRVDMEKCRWMPELG